MMFCPLLHDRNGGILVCREATMSRIPIWYKDCSSVELSLVSLKSPTMIMRWDLLCSSSTNAMKSLLNSCLGFGYSMFLARSMDHCWLWTVNGPGFELGWHGL